MFLWSIRLIIISVVMGWRDYYKDYLSIFGSGDDQCPLNHVHVPGFHPHQCLSVSEVCIGVTKVEIRNLYQDQHLCHPRFKTFKMQIDNTTVICKSGYMLQIELTLDLNFIYSCVSALEEKCEIYYKTPRKQGCQFCRPPFYGQYCHQTQEWYDQRFHTPPRQCAGQYCLECFENQLCSKCHPTHANSEQIQRCDLDCQGFTTCYLKDNQLQLDQNCEQGWYKFENKCYKCSEGCSVCSYRTNQYGRGSVRCWQCDPGYLLLLLNENGYFETFCYISYNCLSNYYVSSFWKYSNGEYGYTIKCEQCNIGYSLTKNEECVLTRTIKNNCFHLNEANNKCLACMPWYALQPDGSCSLISCSPNCQTCLDTNPQFCTTCDGSTGKALDEINGICLCLPPTGVYNDICKPCKDGYCNECEMFDFFLWSNRIVVNQECICQPGTYDPQNDDQICLACDKSCLTCSGPSKYECTQCLDESISNRISIDKSCPCKIGYADSEIREFICGKCHPRCRTCFKSTDETMNQYCLTCIPGENRIVTDNFTCDCQFNYGDNNGTYDICFTCHYTCGNCQNPEPTGCTYCLLSSNRDLTTYGECLCQKSYYDDENDNIECKRCFYTCQDCTKSPLKDSCTECPVTRIPNNPLTTSFESICSSPQTFDDGFSLTCQECHHTCQTCNGPLPSNCLSCNTTYRVIDFSSCVCPFEYFDIGELECQKCHYSCYKCFDNTAEGCIVCSLENHNRFLKGNICKCADGFYEDLGIALCKKCSYKCETCEIKEDQCLSCPLNSFRVLDLIKGCQCSGEFYENENEVICQKCHFKCKSCIANGENNCLTCDAIAYRELKDNQCKCKPHYFEMNVQECNICSAFCYECINTYNNCTSCYNDRYIVGSTCQCITKFQGSSISKFEFNGGVKCQNCHYSCATCMGITETDCISCIDVDQRYQDGNTCLCKEGHYDAGLPICEKCSYKCKGCKKQAEMCISCKDNTFRLHVSGFNKCQCIQRYYDDGQNDVCQKCHYSCLRCNDIDTKCELCSIESNRTFNDQLFTCDCNVGYFDNGEEICQKCHYSCFTCNSGNSNSCMSCIDQNTSNRVFYNNTCKCLFGYYDDGQSTSCQKCDIRCQSCINQSYSCLSCPQTRKIEQNCKCLQGYYETGQQLCQQCNQNCMSCEFTPNNCTSCSSDQFRVLNLSSKTCNCQSGYLEIDGICQQCHQSCSTCSQSINNCAACNQFRYLKNNKCICNEGMYESIQDKQCKLCNKTCLTCTYTSDYCLTCSIDNHRIFKSGNICECEQGYFENPITQNCLECDKSCLTCSLQFDNCLSCDSSFQLSLVNNKCLCSQSYYFDSSTKQCLQCNITCLECNNNIQCILCRGTTRHFDSDTKKCICNQGYYETNEQNCQQCHFSCETCENTNNHCLSCLDIYNRILTNNQCLCKDGYYEVGFELCQKCNNICKTCLSTSTNCLSCYDIEQFRFLLGDKCLCNPGYFESGSDICLKCSNQCKTCQGQDDYCTSCDIDSKRVDQSIIHKCPCIVGFYEDQNKICQKCHIKCQTCINQSGQCLSCKVYLNSNRNNLSDLCNCKQGYYDDGTQIQCQKCNLKCQTCENDQNNCLICQNSIRVNPPTCNCMDGYYEDEQQICQICASQCHTCILQESNCLICREGRIGKDCRCFDGYFEFGSLLCEKCAFQCASCDSSQQNCKTCKGDRIQEPQCICQPGYFDDLLNENCQKCNSFCLECNIDGCLSCNANRILNEEMDCIPPSNSVWYDHTPWCSTCQIAVVKTYLSDDISKIIIRFDFPLNLKGFYSQIQINKCLQLFELETTKSFGNNAVCYLNPDDFQELFITLGENSSINVGDEILFQSNSLSHINCGTALQKFFFTTLQMPINPIPTQIQYNVPPHLLNPYAENLVYVNQISNNGNRKLKNILWSYEAEDNEKRETLNQFLDQNNLIQDYNLFIPKFTLPPNSLIKFKIQYQNFIHIKSFSEFTLLTHSGEYPQININLKPYYFVFEQISVSLSVGTLNQSKLQDNSRYQIQIFEKDRQPKKTTSSHINISIQSNPFETIFTNISKYTLSPNTTYTFQINSTNLMTSKSQIQQFKIHIPFAGLICQFNNRGIQSIRQDLNLQIKCKDLDTRYDWNNDPDLYIQVSCKDLSLNNTCKNQQKQTIHVNATDFIQFIKKNSMSTFIVQEWTVNVTKFSQSSKFNLIIVYLEDNFPSLELEYNQGYYMRKVNNFEQLNFTFLIPLTQKRYLLDLSIAIIYNYEIIEILQPQYTSHNFKIFNSIKELNFGDTINLKFSAQYTNNIMPSLNNIKLNINQPPICSKLFIIRSNDLALTNIQVATICEQSNDFPYKYQLRLFLRESDLTEFQKENQIIPYQNQFQIQIPTSIDQSIVGILVSVLDNGGSMSHIFDKVTVKPAKLDCSQIQFQNLTLQNKISLLFESMNQKCDQLHYLIYLDLHYQQIFPNTNENTLKFQAIKLYKQFLYQLPSNQSQNRLLSEETQIKCFDLKSNHLFITSNSTYTVVNLTKKIENLQQENDKLDIALIYFSEMKRKCLEELNVNQFMWNEEIFQKYQTSQDGLLTLLYYIDDIYSDFSKVNTKNETIYKNIVKLLKDINLILEEIQNVVIVNQSPLVLKGKEIFFYIKRRTKQQFNQQFNIESTQEDYLVDFVQSDSIQLRTNPNRFTLELEKNLQKEFNDQTLKIYNQDYYLIQLKNYLKNRFISLENFIAIYSTTFESYQVCSNNIQNQQEYEIKCMLKTMSGNFSLCNLIKIQNNDTIDIRCECNKFGEIFIITSSNFSKVILNNSDQQMFDLVFGTTNLLAIIIFSSILTLTFMTIYILFLLKDCSNKQESLNTEEIIPNTSKSNIDKKRLLYEGCFKVFIANVKLIHQSLSIFYYQDKYINLSYRILEIFSQFNLLLTLTIVECYVFNNSIIFIILFIIANPFIILILRILYKIIKAIYRFKRIAAFISQLLLILLLVIPNLVLFIFQLFNISVKSEQYEVAIIFLGSLLFSQIFVEPLIILVRIIIYRLIAPSIDQKELNPYIHLIHFFIMHSSLEDIFDNFTRI